MTDKLQLMLINVLLDHIFNTKVLQGSVATHIFTAEPDSEKTLKIGQHLPKLWTIKYRVVFL